LRDEQPVVLHVDDGVAARRRAAQEVEGPIPHEREIGRVAPGQVLGSGGEAERERSRRRHHFAGDPRVLAHREILAVIPRPDRRGARADVDTR